MTAGVTKRADTIQVGAIEPLFQIRPPRPDGASFALAPDGERILLWRTKQRQPESGDRVWRVNELRSVSPISRGDCGGRQL